MMKSTSGQNVFFFIPNIIGYFRLILLIASWIFIEQPTEFLSFYITSILLDAVDGWTARKLNQVSDFGAWLDVVVDVIGRGIIWCNLGKYGYAVPAWEWIVFVANHAQADSGQWKHKFDQSPLMVKHVMEKVSARKAYGFAPTYCLSGMDDGRTERKTPKCLLSLSCFQYTSVHNSFDCQSSVHFCYEYVILSRAL
ncbi:uncharacterized protein LOC143462333 isoform X2 [Clavelina lepadiformis]|uniref:uncharacterized protein LOC143462333 isoform X2 n=1 Tax=Clavelina lepadiformis TaxID=159417 RepID=UPI00404129F7